MKIIINADDFGANDGINAAVERAYKNDALNSASLMVYGERAKAAAAIAAKNPKLSVGLHADLKYGTLFMMFWGFFAPRSLRRYAEKLLREQIDAAKKLGIKRLSHLDSHRYGHMVPAVFNVFTRVAAEYGIPRVRVMNENFFRSFRDIHSLRCIPNLGFLKCFGTWCGWILNGARADSYYYGLTYSGELFGRNLRRISVPKKYDTLEIGFHPSAFVPLRRDKSAFIDKSGGSIGLDDAFYNSENRVHEFDALMNPDWVENISH
ncbi:MAG: ChbG/HpnK family deacetylase [Proteobacteria bacterium]|nr:ChbG/HpnK family deacetylase [Pseudomonadota bacterium]